MQNTITEARTIVYNLDTTFEAITVGDERRILPVIISFLEAVKIVLAIQNDQVLHLFVCPAERSFSSGYASYQIPVQNKLYRNDIVRGALWVTKDDNIVRHFPYMIHFTEIGIAFADGQTEEVTSAANILRNVVRYNDHRFIRGSLRRQDLVTKHILPLLSESTETVL